MLIDFINEQIRESEDLSEIGLVIGEGFVKTKINVLSNDTYFIQEK